ncbi:putative cue domain-containing protein [Phaeoacremonium minimum UCRPA7]|uniref:Putative cue domain-containing protein n=1 Tax=Phaeoacremonium minimum (strain UCR-PA7) TaxID=1286976 RepID=R8BWU4_PHAM7|nr:putative cue domain-containing protein [Phaeoacremonium minimum UCRPA7]EOO03841.1 putative cue domain-containing protein [Phaeoacremonium minimum UCRPA7]
MPRMSNEQQINVPSLIVILVLSGLIVRYLFFSAPTPQQPRDSAAALRQREAACERIQQMFPQVDRRTVLWNLSRDGNNVAATTERILAGRMETPPITFQPPPPPGSNAASSSTSQGQTQAKPAEKPAQPDLITRYNLQDKVAAASASEAADQSGKKGWSTSRDERQSLLQKRRDEMILAARKKMEAKIAAEKAGSGSGN